ncbi:hypothetical protein V5O48_007961 [Marasmius crinis-equi]|uniref:Uncharacterized protein n=1 Tax=Marasmius crinis-equi TaxID=585013 RepID=A0ABR3FFD4_9AGAR
MEDCRGQINAENLSRQSREFIEDYAERYDISKSLPTKDIIAKIFTNGRKIIPILQQHVWELNSQGEEDLVERFEAPEHESFLAQNQPKLIAGSLFDFPPPPEDTYTPSPGASPGHDDEGSDSLSEGSQNIVRGPPPKMEFVYPPKGRPRRDAKGRVVDGEFEPLSDNWLEEMLLDFETGRKDLGSELDDLLALVKDTSFRIMKLNAGIKKERKDKQVFLEALEKICGREIILQVQADALVTARGSRDGGAASQALPAGLPQGRVRVPASSKKKVILGNNPLPAAGDGHWKSAEKTNGSQPGPPEKSPRASTSKRSFREVDQEDDDNERPSSPSSETSFGRSKRPKQAKGKEKDDSTKDGRRDGDDDDDDEAPAPGAPGLKSTARSIEQKGKRRIKDIDEGDLEDDERSDGGSSAPSTPSKRARHRREDDEREDSQSPRPGPAILAHAPSSSSAFPHATTIPSGPPPAGPSTASRSYPGPPPFLWGSQRVDTSGSDVQPVYGPDAHPSQRHLWFAQQAAASSTPGPSSASAAPPALSTTSADSGASVFAAGSSAGPAPRQARPLTRQYNVLWSLDDPAAGLLNLGPVSSPRSRRSGETSAGPIASSATSTNPPPPPPQINQPVASGSTTSPRRSGRLQGGPSAGPSSAGAQASSSAASQPIASGSQVNATPGASTSAAIPPPPSSGSGSDPSTRVQFKSNAEQFFRREIWTRPAPPPPRNLQPRPLRRESERVGRDPVTGRLVAYDHEYETPDFSAARAAQAAEDVADIRRFAAAMQPPMLLEGEPEFVDGEDEEVVLGEHDDLPV